MFATSFYVSAYCPQIVLKFNRINWRNVFFFLVDGWLYGAYKMMVTTFKNSPSRDFHGWSNIYLLCAPVWINLLKDNRENERISIKKKIVYWVIELMKEMHNMKNVILISQFSLFPTFMLAYSGVTKWCLSKVHSLLALCLDGPYGFAKKHY